MGNFNAGLFSLMTQQTTMEETLAAYAIAEIEGNMRETFDALDEEKNGMIEIQNVRHLLERMGTKPTQKQVEKYMAELDTDKSGDVSFEEFSAWYLKGKRASRPSSRKSSTSWTPTKAGGSRVIKRALC